MKPRIRLAFIAPVLISWATSPRADATSAACRTALERAKACVSRAQGSDDQAVMRLMNGDERARYQQALQEQDRLRNEMANIGPDGTAEKYALAARYAVANGARDRALADFCQDSVRDCRHHCPGQVGTCDQADDAQNRFQSEARQRDQDANGFRDTASEMMLRERANQVSGGPSADTENVARFPTGAPAPGPNARDHTPPDEIIPNRGGN